MLVSKYNLEYTVQTPMYTVKCIPGINLVIIYSMKYNDNNLALVTSK